MALQTLQNKPVRCIAPAAQAGSPAKLLTKTSQCPRVSVHTHLAFICNNTHRGRFKVLKSPSMAELAGMRHILLQLLHLLALEIWLTRLVDGLQLLYMRI